MNLTAETNDELDRKLSTIDIAIPPRHAGRTTDDCELWSICRFLAALNQQSALAFPLSVAKRERPDFFVSLAAEEWGVEVTEAVPSSYAKALAIAEKEAPRAIIDISLFEYGEEKTLEEIREIIGASELSGDGWAGDGAARQLADAIKMVVMGKTEKLRAEGFEQYTTNVLLIYNNIPLPEFDSLLVVDLAAEHFADYWCDREIFHRIYVESGQEMFFFHAGGKERSEFRSLW